MKKILFATVVGLALCVAPSVSFAGPPGFYSGGTFVTPPVTPFALGPTVTNYSSFTSPYGYQTYSTSSYTRTPWGLSGYQTGGTFVRPYVSGPTSSVYWDPFANTYQYTYPMGGGFYSGGGVVRSATVIPGRHR